MVVKDWMSSPVVTAAPTASVSAALKLMFQRKVHRLPVVDDHDKLVGIVTRGALLELDTPSTTTAIGAVMTPTPFTTHPLTPVEHAATRMRDLRVGALPVLEDGRLVGIITESDIFDAFLELLGVGRGSTVTIALGNLAADLTRALDTIAAAGVPLNGVTSLAHRGSTFALFSVDEKNRRALVQALAKVGLNPAETHVPG
ncbi:MAG TPA: CBS domain-containing protein [bacterium]|nr:CBS domain-containing protein [bacterium]